MSEIIDRLSLSKLLALFIHYLFQSRRVFFLLCLYLLFWIRYPVALSALAKTSLMCIISSYIKWRHMAWQTQVGIGSGNVLFASRLDASKWTEVVLGPQDLHRKICVIYVHFDTIYKLVPERTNTVNYSYTGTCIWNTTDGRMTIVIAVLAGGLVIIFSRTYGTMYYMSSTRPTLYSVLYFVIAVFWPLQ